MAKGKNANLTSAGRARGRGRANGRKGRAANAQTRRGLVVTTDNIDDTSTRPESVVSDDIQALSARTDDDMGKDGDDQEQSTPGRSGASPLTSVATDVTITVPVAMWVSFSSTPTLFSLSDAIFHAGFRPVRSTAMLGKKTCSTAHHYRVTHRLSISRRGPLVRFFSHFHFCLLCSLDDDSLSLGPMRNRSYHLGTKISLTKAASLSSSVHGHAYLRFPSPKLHLPTNAYVRFPAGSTNLHEPIGCCQRSAISYSD